MIRQSSSIQSPGGAANVAVNLAALRVSACLFGVAGADAEGEQLRAALQECGVSCDGLASIPGRATTLKTRLVTRRQQVVRLDREVSTPLSTAGARALLSRLRREMEHCAGVLVPDYGKGVITRAVWDELLALARRAGIPVVVDPNPSGPLDLYRGVDGIKLNWPEAQRAAQLGGTAETEIEVAGSREARTGCPSSAGARPASTCRRGVARCST